MSHKLVVLARYKRFAKGAACSALVRKAVLCSLADLADDTGAGVFASVPTVAAMAACSDRNVQLVMAELAEEGLIELVGQKSCRGGFTKEWRVNVDALKALPDIKKAVKPLRTSAAKSGADASPLSAEPEVVKPLRTSAEVVKSPYLSGAATAPKPLNLDIDDDRRAPAQRVVDAVDHPKLDPHKSQRLVSTSAKVASWLRAGASLDEIIDTVRAVMQRRAPDASPVETWGYFDRAVRQAVADRLAAEQDQPAIKPSASAPRQTRSRSLTNKDEQIVAGLQSANLNAEAQRFIAEITGAAGASAISRHSLRARYRELFSEPDWAFRLDYFRTECHWPEQWGPQPGEPGYRGPSQQSATEGEAHP